MRHYIAPKGLLCYNAPWVQLLDDTASMLLQPQIYNSSRYTTCKMSNNVKLSYQILACRQVLTATRASSPNGNIQDTSIFCTLNEGALHVHTLHLRVGGRLTARWWAVMCISNASHEEACRLDTYTNRQRQLWTPHLRHAMLIQSDWVQDLGKP